MSTVSDPTHVAPVRETSEAPAHAPTSSIPDAATSAIDVPSVHSPGSKAPLTALGREGGNRDVGECR